ncbi:hypothetical protein O2W18_21430 [Modestobacter sp. VKM Ac-2983]|uniref:hypothetical protein n=1 Tax=Modestobacter sp. VKM Ac-2983 TaxID=3004137 RepID=UPI0022AB9D9B|nr:hypothetical protein [Modestobacter sp. VKM Ac-2983]MCZ2807677.1 hypothetical protein [Modestobacter sp. VKM Ac-2983]
MRTHRPGPHGGIRRRLFPLLMAGGFALGATGCSGDEVENEDIAPVEDTVAPVDPTVEPDE